MLNNKSDCIWKTMVNEKWVIKWEMGFKLKLYTKNTQTKNVCYGWNCSLSRKIIIFHLCDVCSSIFHLCHVLYNLIKQYFCISFVRYFNIRKWDGAPKGGMAEQQFLKKVFWKWKVINFIKSFCRVSFYKKQKSAFFKNKMQSILKNHGKWEMSD
jgi:hypothetical protein